MISRLLKRVLDTPFISPLFSAARIPLYVWASLISQVLIVVTGGVVRLTGSGLGCPTWPKCTAESLITTPEMGIHGIIEWANRMLTFVLALVAILTFVTIVRLGKQLRKGLFAPALILGLGIPAQAVLGGFTVLTKLNPWFVGAHFVLSGYMIAVAIYVRMVPGHAPEVDEDKPPLTFSKLLGVLPIMIIFGLVFGGIYGGFFTPTEGAAVGAASVLITALLKREMTLSKFVECFLATSTSSAMIFLIFIGADVMNSALALTQVPAQLAAEVGSWGLSPIAVVCAILIFYVILGAVMDEMSMLLLTIPIFFPMIMGLDFGMTKEMTAIWFGIMVLMTVGFGMLAPPVGLNVYVVNGMAKDVPLSESYRGIMPFLISDTLRTLLLLFFPGISLYLVGVLT